MVNFAPKNDPISRWRALYSFKRVPLRRNATLAELDSNFHLAQGA
jgi:hypothetical protein